MPGYLVKEERIAVAGVADLTIRSLLDRQQFSDPQGEAEALGISSATWPLFGLLWPSGIQLAMLMALRPLAPGERILEIGCGLALASLVSHRRGADVTASDCHPLAGGFLRENVLLNGLPPLPYRHGQWGSEAEGAAADPAALGRFGLIIGSDVLYERDDSGALPQFIEHHALAAAEVLIVDPDRSNRPAFSRRMRDMGFTLQETRLDQTPEAGGYKGRLLHYRRPAIAA
ncbi:MAG: SAM-dependent methyltransferase [Zoogloea sp.]|nr:SAM-dependent methyltransferase [Zoogloea sp.]